MTTPRNGSFGGFTRSVSARLLATSTVASNGGGGGGKEELQRPQLRRASSTVLRDLKPSTEWQTDSGAVACALCQGTFTVTRRKHHCRYCGAIACETCSARRIDSQRTCIACWEEHAPAVAAANGDDSTVAAAFFAEAADANAAAAEGAEVFEVKAPPPPPHASIGGSSSTPKKAGPTKSLAAVVAGAAAAGAAAAAERTSGTAAAVQRMLEEPRFNRQAVLDGGGGGNNGVLKYADAGDPEGFPLILLLGVDGHRYVAASFDDMARRHGLRLLCPDRPARFGAAGKATNDPTDATAAAADAIGQLCESLGLTRIAVTGQSMGAAFALRLALEPRTAPLLRDTTILLVSPWVPLSQPGTRPLLRKLSRLPLGVVGGAGRIGGAIVPRQMSPAEAAVLEAPATREILRQAAQNRRAGEGGGGGGGPGGMNSDELAAALGTGGVTLGFSYDAVMHPVHVFHGRSDFLVPAKAVRLMAESMPSCQVTMRLGGTHALLWDRAIVEKVFSLAAAELGDADKADRLTARRRPSGVSYALQRPAPLTVPPTPSSAGRSSALPTAASAVVTATAASTSGSGGDSGGGAAASATPPSSGWFLKTGRLSPRRAKKSFAGVAGAVAAFTAAGRRASLNVRIKSLLDQGNSGKKAPPVAAAAEAAATVLAPATSAATPAVGAAAAATPSDGPSVSSARGVERQLLPPISQSRQSPIKAMVALALHVCFAAALSVAVLCTRSPRQWWLTRF